MCRIILVTIGQETLVKNIIAALLSQEFMKICVAQIRPVKGDIRRNLHNHKRFIELAASKGAHTVIFPELSLTGYEPTLAKELAIDPDDKRLDGLQEISDRERITVGVGVPVKNGTGIFISMVIFQPHKQREFYYKQYLHADEEPYFARGQYQAVLKENKIGLAICYEISIAAHPQHAFDLGAEIYVASVAKTVEAVAQAIETLCRTASKYSMTVLMSNCVGECDGLLFGGKTSAWNSKGSLVGQLSDNGEGLLIVDTDSQDVTPISL